MGRVKNIFLDRDGTINEIIFRGSKATSPRTINEFKYRDDFLQFYKRAKESELDLFIISNQPEISRGIIDRNFLEEIENIIRRDCIIRDVSYCLHDDSDKCSCRKPEPGMIINMLSKHSLLPEETLMVGDTWKDIVAGRSAGIKTALLKRQYNRDGKCRPDYEIENLMDLWGTRLI
jgi:D-glycero-D-manno-heptose 1,7-bisphosphate phosphatase